MTDDATVQPTAEQLRDIEIARAMAAAGIPIFVCPPNPYRPGKYFIQAGWPNTVPDPAALDAWKPGWGVAAVGGRAADWLDMDPRNGGIESQELLKNEGDWPLSFGQQATPSGGTHDMISSSGIGKETGFLPGIDFQGGLIKPDEEGETRRAFVWLAPTVGISKVTREPVAYRWIREPDLDGLEEWRASDGTCTDESVRGIVDRVLAAQSKRRARLSEGVYGGVRSAGQGMYGGDGAPGPGDGESSLFGPVGAGGGEPERAFTREQAEAFVRPHFDRLREAVNGQVNERGMALTLALEHFVPAFWTVSEATSIIYEGLATTPYDPEGTSDWTADQQFIQRIDGRRPVRGSWKASKATLIENGQEAAAEEAGAREPTGDEVDALLAEMLSPAELARRPAPRALVKGLLNMDSESWIIGPPGSKKTFVAQDIAGHVALGRPWQGLKVTQARVVMVVAEGAGGMSTRVLAWEKRNGPLGKEVFILPRPVQARDGRAWRVLVEACRRLEPGLVVIDTQARVTVGLEENSATDMGLYIEAVRAIREATGACVLTVHHTGRKGGDARGSSAIDGAQHTELKVTSEGLRGALSTEKQKDMEAMPDMPLVFEVVEVGTDEDGDPVTSLVLAPDAFARARGGETADRPEVEPWERFHGPTQIHLIKVLRDQGGSVGLTKPEARVHVVERFHGGDQKRLARSTYATAWMKVLEKVAPDGSPVAVNVGGQRWGIDPLALDSLGSEPLTEGS